MDKRLIVVVAVVALGIFMLYLNYDSQPDYNVTASNVTLNVSLKNPVAVHKLAREIKTEKYYQGYDDEALKWIESLRGKCAFFGENKIVIMDNNDAKKISSTHGMDVSDVSYYEIFSCDVLANRSLGNPAGQDEVLLVNNVKYIKEDVYYYEV